MKSPLELYSEFELEHPEAVRLCTYKRNQYILQAGQREPYSYLIHEGAVRIVYNSDGQEQIIRFGYQGSMLASLPAFFDEGKSMFDIIAIRKTVIKTYDKQVLFDYIETNSELQFAFTAILKSVVAQQIEREIDLLTQSPLERYQRVLERSPNLFQEIPALYIANYLRMTPEHLSRLRNLDSNQD